MLVRFFAAAAEAAGAEAREVTVGENATLGEVVSQLEHETPALAPVLAHCTFLVSGTATTDRSAPVAGAGSLDVLPPFAGG